jgi:hypothetical protein
MECLRTLHISPLNNSQNIFSTQTVTKSNKPSDDETMFRNCANLITQHTFSSCHYQRFSLCLFASEGNESQMPCADPLTGKLIKTSSLSLARASGLQAETFSLSL